MPAVVALPRRAAIAGMMSESNSSVHFNQRRRRGLTAACQALDQNRTACFVSAACCLLASAEAALRARPAATFAALNHMIIGGFFFNQGLRHGLVPFNGPRRGLHSMSRRTSQEYCSAP